MEDSVKADCSITSQALYQQYLMEKLENFINPGNGDLDYQIEYIIAGKDNESQFKNDLRTSFGVREGINVAGLMADPVKVAQVTSVAAAIGSQFLIPSAAGVIKSALILCWKLFAEKYIGCPGGAF